MQKLITLIYLLFIYPGFFHRDLGTYSIEFIQAYGNKQRAIVGQVDDITQHIELFMEMVSLANQDDLEILISKAENIMSASKFTARCLDLNPVTIRPTNNNSYLFLPEFPVGRNPNASETCRNYSEVNIKLKDLLLELPKVMLPLINASGIESFLTGIDAYPFELLLVNLRGYSSTFSLCYGEYISLLTDIQKWYRSLVLGERSDVTIEKSVEYEIDVSNAVSVSQKNAKHQ